MRDSRFFPTVAMAAALAACSSQDDQQSANASVNEEVAADAAGPPGIVPHAAPGVAFSYRYAFVLADARISKVQEDHAAACERLGPTRCRITGMNYSLIDEDRVSARLDFKLAPELARQFGKDGIAAVEKAEGKLISADIEGDDAGGAITESQARSANLTSELARIEQRLAQGGIAAAERAELQRQAGELRRQLTAERDTRTANEQRLANTPMAFTYEGDEGFRFGSNPFDDGVDTAWTSFATMVSLLLIVIGAALPWALLLALLILAWRSRIGRRVRRFFRGDREAPPADAAN